MSRIFNILIIFIIALTGISFLTCDIFGDEDIEIIGTWLNEAAYGKQKLLITNYKITAYWQENSELKSSDSWNIFWEATIYNYDNEIWNGDEVGSGDCGYMVMKYTTASEYHPEGEDKFMVLRWKNLSAASMYWSEGFKMDPESEQGDCGIPEYYCGIYFDSISEAEEYATDSEGYFGMYSHIEKIED